MADLLKLFAPLHIESWYVLAAVLLAFVLQVSKKTPYVARIWALLPKQWRWLWTVLAGFATGFVQGYLTGLPAVGAVLAGVGGAFGVGLLAGGINDWLEKSVLPWPGAVRVPVPESLPGPEAAAVGAVPDEDEDEDEESSPGLERPA